jgi:hypothetical protein
MFVISAHGDKFSAGLAKWTGTGLLQNHKRDFLKAGLQKRATNFFSKRY